MEKKLKDKNTDLFFDAILHLKSVDECFVRKKSTAISLMKQVQARQQSAVLTVRSSTAAADMTLYLTE